MFAGHPDLRRLLTDYGFIGHPFRKDFPAVGPRRGALRPRAGPRDLPAGVDRAARSHAADRPRRQLRRAEIVSDGRNPQLHDELRASAPGGARGAAARARARRRGDRARGSAHRAPAPRDREARRAQDVHPVAALHGPARLRVDDVQRARLLPGDRAAARARGAGARAIHPRDVRRDHADPQSPAVARLPLARRRRDDDVPLLLPRARGPVRHVRGGVRRADARGVLPAGRRLPRPARADAAVRGAALTQRARDGRDEREPAGIAARLHRGLHAPLPRLRRRLRDAADREPHLEAAHGRHRRRHAGARDGAWVHRRDAARVGCRMGPAQEAAVRGLRPDGVRHPGRHQRRLLRPLSRPRRGDAPVEPDRPAVRRLAARRIPVR